MKLPTVTWVTKDIPIQVTRAMDRSVLVVPDETPEAARSTTFFTLPSSVTLTSLGETTKPTPGANSTITERKSQADLERTSTSFGQN
jgi:hypothetical protein